MRLGTTNLKKEKYVRIADLEFMVLNCQSLRQREAVLETEREATEYLARPIALFCLSPANKVRQTAHTGTITTSIRCIP